MKQKIYTPYDSEYNVCHSELVSDTSDSELAKQSHFQISKLTHLLIFSFFFLLSSFLSYGQEYQWQWAKSGGGELGFSGGVTQSFRDECVIDIVVDADNNYYYLMSINGNSPMYNDDSLPGNLALEHYGSKDILLLSTDENGNYRWHQVIGGYSEEVPSNIIVDSYNGVYLNASLRNSTEGSTNNPIHLTSEVTLPQRPQGWDSNEPHSTFRLLYLLKYAQSDGSLLDYKTYQGEVNLNNSVSDFSRLWIDSENYLHTYVSLRNGTHLDGLVTIDDVDENDFSDVRTYLVKLDTSLNIIGTPREFPINGTGSSHNFFVYNEDLNTYYIGGRNDDSQNISYNDVEIEEESFILAINGETLEEEWRSGFNDPGTATSSSTSQTSIFIDDESNIYLPGRYTYSSSFNQRYFGDYELPENIEGGDYLAHVPFVIKLNSDGEVQWIRVPDSFTNQFSRQKQNENESVTVVNGEVVIVPRNPGSTWGDFEIVSSQDYNTVPAIVRLNPDTGEVIGATHLEGYGAFTKVVGDRNGDIVLGGSFFGQMFSDHDDIPTLQAISNRTDFFMTKLVLDTDSSTENFLQANIKVYPNPTTDIVYFETEDPLKHYTVYNQNAQQVKVKTQINDTNYQMSFEGLPSGTYFVLIRTESGKNVTAKIVKE